MSLLEVKRDGLVRASDLARILNDYDEVVGIGMKALADSLTELREEVHALRRELEAERRLHQGPRARARR